MSKQLRLRPVEPRLIVGASCTLCDHRYPDLTGADLVAAHGKHCAIEHVGVGSVKVRIPARKLNGDS